MSVGRSWVPVRSHYDALGELRVDPQVRCTAEEDMCRQADAKACDINLIVRSHLRQFGQLPPAPAQVFADVSQGWDYREMMEKAAEAEEYFGALPAEMRERYGNDVGRFLNEIWSNEADAIQIGLVEKPEVPNEVPANPPAE